MAEIFKTLEFINLHDRIIGKYAHPIYNPDADGYVWANSEMPLLMTEEANLDDLKEMYPGLDWELVKLVNKQLIDI
jgi:hypothetical protein